MNNALWIGRVERSFDADELVGVVRDYLAECPAERLNALPQHCRPQAVANADDVALWAYRLTACHCTAMGAANGDDPLFELSTFFGGAARRLAILAAQRAALLHSSRTRISA